jgi:large subunit ribosomal protein L3
MKGIIGKKLGMTHLYQGDRFVPVTVIQAGPCVVVQRKTVQSDGYNALQIGMIEKTKESRLSKALLGHTKQAGFPVRRLAELRSDNEPGGQIGEKILVTIFQEKDKVTVTGFSKGKGFQGVVFRHHFRGGPASHGSMFHRAPGSIGSSSYPSRVWKGMRMGGKMGAEKVTVQNLEVIRVEAGQNLLYVKGAVPGGKGSYLMIKTNGRN